MWAVCEFFKSGEANTKTPPVPDEEVAGSYRRRRAVVFPALTIGYGMFYVCRKSLSVVKQPLLDSEFVTADQIGLIGAALLFVYAFGKCFNGFLADHTNIKRFMTAGLVGAAVVNVAFGLSHMVWLLICLSALHGWFQSMGAAPSVVSLSQWFPKKRRGTFYGIWSMSHYIGKAITFMVTAALVSYVSQRWGFGAGWRFGFIGSGAICLGFSVLLYLCLADRPKVYGLPPLDTEDTVKEEHGDTVGRQQLAVLRNPAVWLIGLSSALMYISRYAVEDWGILYLQKAKDYSLTEAGLVMGIGTIPGIVGSILSGWVSDRFFNARRDVPTILCGVLQIASLLLLFGYSESTKTMDCIAVSIFFAATGALLVYLGGLIAIDLASKQAAGAAMGVIGIFSYLGAGIQDVISGRLIGKGVIGTGEAAVYTFDTCIRFWIGAAICSCVFAFIAFFYIAIRKRTASRDTVLKN